MNKENNQSAAGLRRSAVVERIRLREEWSALKGSENTANNRQNVMRKVRENVAKNVMLHNHKKNGGRNEATEKIKTSQEISKSQEVSDALRGVVALVEVGSETKALPLRAALTALGASIMPRWSPLVTHLIWSEGGCRATRSRALALACGVVSPLWVEACAAGARRLPERAFPAARRPSDLPSPRTLRYKLKKAEAENIPLFDHPNDKDDPRPRLRISSETEHDSSATTDTSRDTSHDKSRDKTGDTTGIESRVNTAPRRALPLASVSPCPKPTKPKRKLFTHKEGELHGSADESDAEPMTRPSPRGKLTQRERRDLVRAERLARRLLVACAPPASGHAPHHTHIIVLTGMGRAERQRIAQAVQSLGGKIQTQVNKRTTHVILGSCRADEEERTLNPEGITPSNITGITPHDLQRGDTLKARTVNALVGAARGCRVLSARWAVDSMEAKKWLHHHGYEVPHLRKISQKARVERLALGKMRSEYAYDVFNGMKVKIAPTTQQKDAAIQLLTLCGAVVQDGRSLQDGGGLTSDFDMTLGTGDGEISSKWVFDSVAASRMRTTRRYTNNYIRNSANYNTQMTQR